MPRTTNVDELRLEVVSRAGLRHRGWSERAIAGALLSGDLLRLSRTHSIEREIWNELWPEGKLLARVLAVAPLQRGAGCFCRESAATLHGLPLYRGVPGRAQLLFPQTSGVRSTARLERHTGRLAPGDVVTVSGIPCTSLERTLVDLSRFASPETALACVDAALREKNLRRRGEPLSPEAAVWFARLSAAFEACRGARGGNRATRILSLADHGAESPLESVARLRFTELGYRVRTQVPIPSPNGGHYFADLELDGLDVLVEVDGLSKYADEELRGDRSIAQTLLRERRREEWNRGRTGKRSVRVMAPDVSSIVSLRRVIRDQRIPPPRTA